MISKSFLLAIALLVILSPSACGPSAETTTSGNQVVTFADSDLEAAIREAINKARGPIYASELKGLTSFTASGRNINNLTGLEYCVNLTELDLHGNQVSDISALRSLTNLSTLHLDRNQITDISPLASLTHLSNLRIFDNQIRDISPLASLSNLTELILMKNQIADISPLASLTNLTLLNLRINEVSDVSPLASLTDLAYLRLSENQIADISPLSSLTALTQLDLNENPIGDIKPLAFLTNLTDLSLTDCRVSDISPLVSLTNLWCLHLSGNQISDIEPLVANSGLSEGDTVGLIDNPLSNTSINEYIVELEERGVAVGRKLEGPVVQKGIWSIDTVEEASQIAGYAVATPLFLPEGFHRSGKITVSEVGALTKTVDQQWYWPEDPKIHLLLIQVPAKEGNGSGEPIEVCGNPGRRELHEAGKGREHPLLVLHWQDGDMGYSLGGSMAGPLTEEILHNIACSVRTQ